MTGQAASLAVCLVTSPVDSKARRVTRPRPIVVPGTSVVPQRGQWLPVHTSRSWPQRQTGARPRLAGAAGCAVVAQVG